MVNSQHCQVNTGGESDDLMCKVEYYALNDKRRREGILTFHYSGISFVKEGSEAFLASHIPSNRLTECIVLYLS